MSAAAANLSISQSAVSQAILDMERHFDTKLFDRVGNKVYLTDAGRNMANCSSHVISYLSHMESIVRSDTRKSVLHLGDFSQYMIVDLAREYQDHNPAADLVIHAYPQNDLVSMLAAGALDVIITDSKPNIPGAVSYHLFTTKSVFICHPESKLHPALAAEHPVLELGDLEEMPMLLRDEGSTSRIQFEEMMTANQVNFFCKGVFFSNDGIFAAASKDLGIGLTVSRTTPEHHNRFKQVEVLGADITQEVYLSYMSRRQAIPGLQDLVEFIRTQANVLYNELLAM